MYYITSDREIWTRKKLASRVAARRMFAISENFMLHSEGKLSDKRAKADAWRRRAARVASCAERLSFRACPECNIRYITHAELCKDRLCPICAWRRSRALAARLRGLVSDNKRYVLLTLTIKNCPWQALGEYLKRMLAAWTKLQRRSRFKAAFPGWVRTVEITHGKNGLAHPHLHILLETNAHYFDKQSDLWISHQEFVEMWRKCLAVEYNPTVDIRAVKNIGGAVAEVTKYIAKDVQIDGLCDTDFLCYAEAIAGVRTWAAGGTMRAMNEEIADEELLKVEGTDREDDKYVCPICGRMMIEEEDAWSNIERCYKNRNENVTIINNGVINIWLGESGPRGPGPDLIILGAKDGA